MRSISFAAAFLLFASIGQCQTITAAQAREHDGETATVAESLKTNTPPARLEASPPSSIWTLPFPIRSSASWCGTKIGRT